MSTHTNPSSITRQLRIVFGISVVILLASSYASFYSNQKLIDSSRWVNHTYEVIVNADDMLATVKDAEAGERGYIISNDASFLKPYNNAYDRAMKIHAHLQSLTLDNPVQQQNLEIAKKIIDERFAQMEETLRLVEGRSATDRVALFAASSAEIAKGGKIMADLQAKIEGIKGEENRLLKIRTSEQDTYTTYTPMLVMIAAAISVLISLLAYFRIKSDLEARMRKQKQDEEKYIETGKRISAMEAVTRGIAAGNYNVRSTDEEKDELGRIATALNEMIISLEKNFNELNKRNWLQEGASELSNAIRGEMLVNSISGKIIKSLAAYLGAEVGTLYIADKSLNLKLYGGYAETDAPTELLSGKGLVGQAIASREMIVTGSLPADYMHISSSIGNTMPAYAVVLPLIFGDTVIGAVELGMLRKPLEIELLYLKNNAEAIAIGINAALNFERMQNLLEETQAQSEELQAQHNELENINSELEVQKEKLQASEEELRVQQEELQQANEELEERSALLEEKNHQITEKNEEVQRKAEELAQSTKYKSEFLANMSHELRTPLNSILLLSRLLAENNETNLSADQVEFAKVIQSSGNGLLSLIDEILDLSKIEAGKMQLEYDDVAVQEIAEDMQALFGAVAKEKKIALTIVADSASPKRIETDKLRLEQILKNLLSNALKFTKEGTVELIISDDPLKDGYVRFTVTDTGIGIAADKQQQIFEAFQQEDGSTRRKFGGTGLGLSISRELAKLLGGEITLTSKQGIGSTFAVSVPASMTRRPEVTHAPEEVFPELERYVEEKEKVNDFISARIPESIPDDRAVADNKDKVILIVEDDTGFAKSLLEFTRKKGYKGIVAVRGDVALGLAKEYKPAGILLDIELPIKNGWQVMQELKGDPLTRHIPVHIMSSHSVKRKSLMQGAVDFVDKPVAFEQMQEIFSKLEHVLNRDSKKVLIVEENPMHAKALSYFLETFHISSDIKNTIPDSINALKHDADCVILDMGIPDANAYTMLDEVKKDPALEHLPIIVFTGKSLSMAEEHRIKKYADSIVVKTAHSYQRILDEVSLFLHIVEESKPVVANDSIKRLGMLGDVLKDRTVLIVDDDVRNIFSLTKSLEQLHMNIITAIDGKEALEKMNEHARIDIVLLDMMMPKMDGYETAKRIRQNPAWKKLPVIAVTAKAMTGDRDKCIQAGASDYITKPVDIDQLLSLLRVWLYEKIGK